MKCLANFYFLMKRMCLEASGDKGLNGLQHIGKQSAVDQSA
jgi:hypothetical protein